MSPLQNCSHGSLSCCPFSFVEPLLKATVVTVREMGQDDHIKACTCLKLSSEQYLEFDSARPAIQSIESFDESHFPQLPVVDFHRTKETTSGKPCLVSDFSARSSGIARCWTR